METTRILKTKICLLSKVDADRDELFGIYTSPTESWVEIMVDLKKVIAVRRAEPEGNIELVALYLNGDYFVVQGNYETISESWIKSLE